MRNEYDASRLRMTPREFLIHTGPSLAVGLLAFYATWGKYHEAQSGSDQAPWFIAAAALYLLGTIADKVSSVRVTQTAARANAVGIKVKVYETNPFLPQQPTVKDLLMGRKLPADVGAGIIGTVLPPVGIALGSARLAVAMKNELIVTQPMQRLIDKRTHYRGS